MWETWVWSLGWEDPLEEGMETHSNILDWRLPWTEEPSRLQTRRLQRVGHDWATKHTAHSQLTMQWWFQVNSKGIKPFMYPFSPNAPPTEIATWHWAEFPVLCSRERLLLTSLKEVSQELPLVLISHWLELSHMAKLRSTWVWEI